jgi:hypothetical protein
MRWFLLLALASCNIYTEDLLLPAPSDPGTDAGSGSWPVLYATGFEPGEPSFQKLSGSGTLSTDPPPGTTARSGTRALTSSALTSDYADRDIRSGCVAIGSGPIAADAWATASTENGENVVWGRIVLVWHDEGCQAEVDVPSYGLDFELPQGEYQLLSFDGEPPDGADGVQLRFEVRRTAGASTQYGWAADDISMRQE